MSALPEGRYEGLVLASRPTPRHRMYHVDIRLTKTGEQIEAVMFSGRDHAVMLGLARLKFVAYGQPWLPDQDRSKPLPVLVLDLSFDQKYPDRNRLTRARRTGVEVVCDVREAPARTDFAEF